LEQKMIFRWSWSIDIFIGDGEWRKLEFWGSFVLFVGDHLFGLWAAPQKT
jgi:hypothetical protein